MDTNICISVLNENTAYDLVWRKLRKFHDEELTTRRLMQLHQVPSKHRDNARKQAQQLSYTLTQAYEFSKAAQRAGPPTKALLAYYSLTALANAEILWRGTGEASFDGRPAAYNSHGFELRKHGELLEFSARPQFFQGELRGLYGLWRKTASHLPHYGMRTTRFPHSFREGLTNFGTPSPLNEIRHPDTPISLRDCFAHLPGMQQLIGDHSIVPELARGVNSQEINIDENNQWTKEKTNVIIHPCSNRLKEAVIRNFSFPAKMVPYVQIIDMPSGAMFSWSQTQPFDSYSIHGADAFPWKEKMVYFCTGNSFLNEFAYFYFGLYITGMITRYHPQFWIKELKTATHASSLIDDFVDHSLQRVPLLTLAAIGNEIIVYQ